MTTEIKCKKQDLRGVMDTLASQQPITQEQTIAHIKKDICEIKKRLDELQRAKETSDQTEHLNAAAHEFQTTPSHLPEIMLMSTRIQQASKELINHQRQIGSLEKKLEALDNRSGKKNIIIDCLPENSQEDLRWDIEQLFGWIQYIELDPLALMAHLGVSSPCLLANMLETMFS